MWCGFVLVDCFLCEHKFYGAETLLTVFSFVIIEHAVKLNMKRREKREEKKREEILRCLRVFY